MTKHKPTTLKDRLGALWGLLRISDDDYNAYMRSYDELFVDSPENTKADYDNGVPFGLELSARPWRDRELLGMAQAWEQVTPARTRPTLVDAGLLPVVKARVGK